MADAGGPGLPADRDGYRYVPLRREDIEPLRRFRNEQMDVLRQAKPLSFEQQAQWFEDVVLPARRDPKPRQILVSILDEGGAFVGYGGLTNIDWRSRRGEVSFLVDPKRAADPHVYGRDMSAFLEFLGDWAFGRLGLNRVFTETYAFREHHMSILQRAGFSVEGRLREHVMVDDRPCDSMVHGLLAAEWRAR